MGVNYSMRIFPRGFWGWGRLGCLGGQSLGDQNCLFFNDLALWALRLFGLLKYWESRLFGVLAAGFGGGWAAGWDKVQGI